MPALRYRGWAELGKGVDVAEQSGAPCPAPSWALWGCHLNPIPNNGVLGGPLWACSPSDAPSLGTALLQGRGGARPQLCGGQRSAAGG